MITNSEILIELHDALLDALTTELVPGELPIINFYTSAGVRLATVTYDGFARDGEDNYLIFLSGSSTQLFSTVEETGDVATFRIQHPSEPPESYLFSGSVGLPGRGADMSFPDTYWPASSTIIINNLRMYVKPGSIN